MTRLRITGVDFTLRVEYLLKLIRGPSLCAQNTEGKQVRENGLEQDQIYTDHE